MDTSPRGIKNRNPGNIEWGQPWQGLAERTPTSDPRFAEFKSAAWGIRALVTVLITYQDKHGINTIKGMIDRWAPPVENDTSAYIKHVAAVACVTPDAPISIHDYAIARAVVEGIIRHENGNGPLATENSWYTADEVNEGLRLAGVVPPKKPTLLTPQGAATGVATAAAGLTAVGQAIQPVVDQVQHLSSQVQSVSSQVGPAVAQVQAAHAATAGFPAAIRIALVVLAVIAAAASGYAFYRKRQSIKAVTP